MALSSVATTGFYQIGFPSWGRCFWQDPNDGVCFLAFASGNTEIDYTYSTDSGNGWSAPAQLFPIDDFRSDNNFDIAMDRRGHIHSVFKWKGSGCYQFTGRVQGGGYNNASGVGPAGFCAATTGTSSSAGMHGSLFISDGALGFSDHVVKFPAARIVAKKADQEVETWYVSHPFNAYPVMDSGVSKIGEQAGLGGGYPIFNDCGFFDAPKVIYSASGALMRSVQQDFGSWILQESTPIVPTPNYTDSGASGLIPFGPHMSFTSGIIGKLYPVVISAASGAEMWVTMSEAEGNGQIFRRVDSSASLTTFSATQRRAPHGWPLGLLPSGQVFNIGAGTLIDITHCNTRDALHIYYLAHDSLGIQNINRILCRMQREHNTVGAFPAQATQFDFSSLSHFTSGIRPFAPATPNNTGGKDGVGYWYGFKAIRHPVRPSEGVTKSELVATIGSNCTVPSGSNLIVWNYGQSIAAQETIHYTDYDYNYTATSGTSVPAFSGIFRTLKVTNPQNCVDFNANTDAIINSGSSITFEFTKPVLFTRMDLATFGTSASNRFPGAVVSGSFDGTNWYYLHTMSSGYTTNSIKVSAEQPQTSSINEHMNPWVARFLKFDWQQSQKKSSTNYNLTELRLYGPGQLKGPISFDGSTVVETRTIFRPEASRGTQRFDTTREGALPGSDWFTSGNFTWGVRASGAWSSISSLPTIPYPQNGYVGSGLFIGASNGNGDGFSLKPNDCVPTGASGLVSVNIKVYSTETSRSSGTLGYRTVTFDYRTDFPNSDDHLDLYLGTSQATEGTLIRRFSSPNLDWTATSFDVQAGDFLIKWIYYRGSTSGNSTNTGQVWIDNIVGLNGPAQPSVGAFIEGSLTPVSGIIYGFMNAKGAMQIYGYMSGVPFTDVINGYVDAVPVQTGSIDGFLNAQFNEKIHGFLIGAGTPSFSSINGLMGSGIANVATGIYGFMRGDGDSNVINGYLLNNNQQIQSIYGFMNCLDGRYRIYGFLPGYAAQTGSIHSYVAGNNVNSSIYGFMNYGPGGGPNPSGSWINGFMNATASGFFIHGYLEGPPGGFGNIYGFASGVGITSGTVNGYLGAAVFSTGNIHGFASGIGFSPGNIYGYLYGVSGIIPSQIYGVMSGVLVPSGFIYGVLTGMPSGLNSLNSCFAHGTIPLPSVTPATIPTGWFNI